MHTSARVLVAAFALMLVTAFAIVHVRPDRTLFSSEALQILTLG